MKIGGLTTKQAFALVALADLKERGKPADVAERMEALGFSSSAASWKSSVSTALRSLAATKGYWGEGWGGTPARPLRYDGAPALLVYDNDRFVRGAWSPYRLTKAGDNWLNRHSMTVLAGATVPPAATSVLGEACPECGALVVHENVHAVWHERMADLYEALRAVEPSRRA